MGVGVEEAVFQHFADDQARGVHGDAMAVEAGGVEGGQIVNLDAAQPLLHHQAARRMLPVDARHVDELLTLEVLAEAVGVATLAAVVQLLAQGVGELVGHLHRIERHEAGQPLAHQMGDVAEDVEVGVNQALDARPLHLDHHVRPVGQQRGVDLGQRGRGDGRGVEGGEDFRQRPAQLSLDQRQDRLPRVGRHVVLQVAQFGQHCRRQDFRPRAGDLAQLDERRAKLLQRQPQPHGRRHALRLLDAAPQQPPRDVEPVGQPQLSYHRAKAVAGQHLGDAAVARQMARAQAEQDRISEQRTASCSFGTAWMIAYPPGGHHM